MGQAAAARGAPCSELDIDSNYELIRTLEPFVRDKSVTPSSPLSRVPSPSAFRSCARTRTTS